ncbi:uncharacterized protein K489DRAFT_378136 [Dissoconium aciculare CBS 342.82]|uniref:Uncharacterized protein n=1 Tax=Dissoconium aciculare CBS 342.82 TaxID=1314786 RepID=A0A6J3MC69_9PEZI|nr:uncharacterized protein K489DRAFT_378136 [Dissoconium aciculare CBS 342.82]KAF1825605.1 hypothetical protein K489DRAFT_378136 [Dissoconium aciculare CBS 342.82]
MADKVRVKCEEAEWGPSLAGMRTSMDAWYLPRYLIGRQCHQCVSASSSITSLLLLLLLLLLSVIPNASHPRSEFVQ